MAFLMPFLFFWAFLVPSMAYADITGKVVDAETSEPIEGAVVLVEWTVTKGLLGMTNTESLKVVEAVTDQEGRFNIDDKVPEPEPDYRLMAISKVNPPEVTIYKRGYVAWNNEYIFPSYKKREDFKWQTYNLYRLVRFKDEYDLDAHISFIHMAIGYGRGEKILLPKAIEEEKKKAFLERQKKRTR